MQYVYLKWVLYIVVVLVFVWMVTGEKTEQKVESSSPAYYEKYYETATKDFKTRPGVKFSKKEKSGTAVSSQEGSRESTPQSTTVVQNAETESSKEGLRKGSDDGRKYGRLEYNGYTYKTVVIGNQEWTAENLRTTRYNNGVSIYKITFNDEWISATQGAYCAYENDESNVATYGYLYNWYAVNTGKLAPATGGWRVPTDADWTRLTTFIGGEETAGTKLKAKSGWSGNGNGTDEYGFSALPGGSRSYYDGAFSYFGSDGFWWSSTADGTDAWYRLMYYNYAYVYRSGYYRRGGFSVRLVRDL